MGKLPSTILRRPSLAGPVSQHTVTQSLSSPQAAAAAAAAANQVRHATFVPRPRRPYQFTQLVQLSDGSTFTMRTTSPLALYKSAKDSRNHILWQPTEKTLRNVEVDEAGKLAAFRERYGTSWDLEAPPSAAPAAAAAAAEAPAGGKQEGARAGSAADGDGKKAEGKAAEQVQASTQQAAPAEDAFDSLVDLISAYATEDKNIKGGLSAKDQARKDRSGKKK
ncbi:hypothetical protein MYCTH_2090930 [Thermothelomyces thermophilus ATCC 42464]|uniref:Ribosomal protein bL31m N-terminal domain-containing protein n=1 Tax=Thermothelomyces thermophilus (strain ATCC 42464 / BCRC 31852 / DSM 1799) TaxID=573729 RepID=G2QAN8_THET4|nr:uncharacterized protein MYCTH_2090930 [Thermothelomyces thermophilus ATCC 42464]AEO56734.1 hypothetical protein MYCTH_2090930 [Thermothelomyces thermophilus ATCC 42464]